MVAFLFTPLGGQIQEKESNNAMANKNEPINSLPFLHE